MASDTTYCHACGEATNADDTFCRQCGAELVYHTDDEDADDSADSAATQTPDDETGSPSVETDTGSTRAEADPDTPDTDRDSILDVSWLFDAPPDETDDPTAASQSRELATMACFGYGGLVAIRVLGLSQLVFLLGGVGSGSGLVNAAAFLFYDGFVFALVGLLTSAYLVARFSLDFDELDLDLTVVDRLAAIGLPAASLLYGLGVLLALLG